ncbi:MAG: DNA-binding protein [Bacteroides sp.]|nr:DNA-binding protein [Bacteroides sp.]
MAKYIKQEVPDMLKTGNQKVFYRLKTERNIDFEEFVSRMAHPGSGISRGEAIRILLTASETLASLLAEGHSVSLDEWGTFKATIGVEPDKEVDTIDGDETKRNSRSLRISGIHFQADKKLVREVDLRCKLERAGVSRVRRSPYTREERLQKALDYLSEHGFMRVKHYMELTGLGQSTAANELRAFSEDPSTGIDSTGRRATLVYINRS